MDKQGLIREILERVQVSFSRSGGPGGQNVNKLNTKVTLRLRVEDLQLPGEEGRQRISFRLANRINGEGEIVLQSSTERSQLMNRERGEARLAGLILEALKPGPKRRRVSKPSRGAQERRLQAKKHRGRIKKNRRYSSDGGD